MGTKSGMLLNFKLLKYFTKNGVRSSRYLLALRSKKIRIIEFQKNEKKNTVNPLKNLIFAGGGGCARGLPIF